MHVKKNLLFMAYAYYFLLSSHAENGLFRSEHPLKICEECIADIAITNFRHGSLIGFVSPKESDAVRPPLNCLPLPINMDELIKETQWTFLIRNTSLTEYDLKEVCTVWNINVSISDNTLF